MNKKIILGAAILLGVLLLLACIPKEIRTVKIEMGPWNHPKANPDIARVKQNLEMAQKQYPDDPDVYHLWGRVYALEDNYVEMNKALAKCDSLSDKYTAINDTIRMQEWDALYNKAIEAYKNQDYEETLTDLKNAIICWPHQYEPYLYGADAAYRLGHNEEAYDLSKQGYEMVPDTIRMARQYGEMCLVNNKLDEAKDVFMKLMKQDPTNPSYLFNVGEIYLSEGDTTGALNYYQQGLQIDDTYAQGYLNISKLYFLVKDYTKAIEAFEHFKALETPKPDDEFLYLLSLYEVEDYEKAKTELEKFTMDNPEYCDAWQLLANVYLHIKMKDQAKEATAKYDKCIGK